MVYWIQWLHWMIHWMGPLDPLDHAILFRRPVASLDLITQMTGIDPVLLCSENSKI